MKNQIELVTQPDGGLSTAPQVLSVQTFEKLGLSHQTELGIKVPGLSNIQTLSGELPYSEVFNRLKVGGTRVMVDSTLVGAAIARLFEATRGQIEHDHIVPFFKKISASLAKSDKAAVQEYRQALDDLLDHDDPDSMTSPRAKVFASKHYATPQGFYSTADARKMGLHRFFRALRWVGMAGFYVDADPNSNVNNSEYSFSMEAMADIRRRILESDEVRPGLESFAQYSAKLAGIPDSVSVQMSQGADMDATSEQLEEEVRRVGKLQGIPKIAQKSGIPFTLLPTAFTATQEAYEGMQRLVEKPFASREEFEEATSVMRAYFGGDPDYPEVVGILNQLGEAPDSAYQLALAMAGRLQITYPEAAALVLNQFAVAETTAAEAVVGLEKQQEQARKMAIPEKSYLRIDPAITQDFVILANQVMKRLLDVGNANGIDVSENERFQRLAGILGGLKKALSNDGTIEVNPDHVADSLGSLTALFAQNPTAAVKVASHANQDGSGFTRVNCVVPMVAIRQAEDEHSYIYASARFGTVVQDRSAPLVTRESLEESRREGKLPEGFVALIEAGDGAMVTTPMLPTVNFPTDVENRPVLDTPRFRRSPRRSSGDDQMKW